MASVRGQLAVDFGILARMRRLQPFLWTLLAAVGCSGGDDGGKAADSSAPTDPSSTPGTTPVTTDTLTTHTAGTKHTRNAKCTSKTHE